MLSRLCTMPRDIGTGVEVEVSPPIAETTASDALVGVTVEPDICKHSLVTVQAGGLGGGNSVDGLDKTLTLDLNPPDLEASTLLSSLLISLFNSVIWENESTNKHMKMCIYLYMHTN